MASWCASAFIPAFLQMSHFFHRSIGDMTYLVGAYTLMMGFGVLVWNPLADRFGRRPILLLSLSECLIATCDVAVSQSYGTIMVARIFQGFGVCAPLSLGAAYMKEMYPPKNRGTALGIWTHQCNSCSAGNQPPAGEFRRNLRIVVSPTGDNQLKRT